MGNNHAKISFGTAICAFIIIVLIIALAVVYYMGFVQSKEKIVALENEKIALEETLKKTDSTLDEIRSLLGVTKTEEKTVEKANESTTANQVSNNKYELVERLALGIAKEASRLYSGEKYIEPETVTINRIEIVSEEYLDTMIAHNQVDYNFKKRDLESGDFELIGSVTYTADWGKIDKTGYYGAGSGGIDYQNYQVITRGFRVYEENGQYKIEFGEG